MRFLLGLTSTVLALGVGCHVLTGVSDLDVRGSGGAGGATGGAGGQGAQTTAGAGGSATGGQGAQGGGGNPPTGGGGTGGEPECVLPSECPGIDKDCEIRSCDGGMCGTTDIPEGGPCFNTPDEVCDALGKCVECITAAQCDGAEVCHPSNRCVPATCINNMLDPGETGVDCGGPDCVECPNGEPCLVPSDCESVFCDLNGGGGGQGGAPAMGVCAPCSNDGDCAGDEYCDPADNGGTCKPKGGLGDPCGGDNQCLSGQCPSDDSVCCDDACGSDCEACLMVKTGVADGTCAQVLDWTDPDDDCSGFETCDPVGGGACDLKPLGISCGGDDECDSDDCADGVCCESSCSGTCRACIEIYTGKVDGDCTDILVGLDPYNECPGMDACDGDGACE